MSLRKKFPILTRTRLQILVNQILNNKFSYRIKKDGSYNYRNWIGESICFPDKAHFKLFNLFYFGYLSHLADKYMYADAALKIDRPRLLIDCGAFVGGASLAARKFFPSLTEIWAVEPTPKTYTCLQKNLQGPIFRHMNVALGERKTVSSFYFSNTYTDNSLSPMTENMTGEQTIVQIETLQDLLDEAPYSDEQVILKVEAEGFEHEVLMGMGTRRPKVILIDISPEREGESVLSDIKEHLRNDYSFHFTPKVLMAVRRQNS